MQGFGQCAILKADNSECAGPPWSPRSRFCAERDSCYSMLVLSWRVLHYSLRTCVLQGSLLVVPLLAASSNLSFCDILCPIASVLAATLVRMADRAVIFALAHLCVAAAALAAATAYRRSACAAGSGSVPAEVPGPVGPLSPLLHSSLLQQNPSWSSRPCYPTSLHPCPSPLWPSFVHCIPSRLGRFQPVMVHSRPAQLLAVQPR